MTLKSIKILLLGFCICLLACKKNSEDYREKFVGSYEGLSFYYQLTAGSDTNGIITTQTSFDTVPVTLDIILGAPSGDELTILSTLENGIKVNIDLAGTFSKDYSLEPNYYCYGKISGDSLTLVKGYFFNTIQSKYTIKALRSN